MRRSKIDGVLYHQMPDGREELLHDPGPLPVLTDAEIHAGALSDPDNLPRTAERDKRLKRVPQVKIMRKAPGLTQGEFAVRFQIPIGILRDWEQGKSEPDTCARAYLKAIAGNPNAVAEALKTRF